MNTRIRSMDDRPDLDSWVASYERQEKISWPSTGLFGTSRAERKAEPEAMARNDRAGHTDQMNSSLSADYHERQERAQLAHTSAEELDRQYRVQCRRHIATHSAYF